MPPVGGPRAGLKSQPRAMGESTAPTAAGDVVGQLGGGLCAAGDGGTAVDSTTRRHLTLGETKSAIKLVGKRGHRRMP